jgi:hypothetical protein
MSLSWTTDTQLDNKVAESSDARVSRRIPMRCWAKLFCETEAGGDKTIRGHVVNASASGILVEALTPIAVGTQVRIQANELLVGAAHVRHSTWRSWRFRIGLEFARPMQDRF